LPVVGGLALGLGFGCGFGGDLLFGFEAGKTGREKLEVIGDRCRNEEGLRMIGS